MPIIPIDQLEQQVRSQSKTPQDNNNLIPIDQLEQQVSDRKEIFTKANLSSETVEDKPITKSPASIIDRLRLSFLDTAQRKQFLEKRFASVQTLPNGKFMVGNDINNLLPVDPEGMFNDVAGDIADIVGEIPVIAGQILGTGIGALAELPSGPIPTTIAGAAAGTTIGTILKQNIGSKIAKQESLSQREAMDRATEIVINTAFGVAGEGLAQGTRVLGKQVLAPKLMNMLDDGIKNSRNPNILIKGAAKLFGILSNVPEESSEVVLTRGVRNTLGNKFYMNKKSVIPLTKRVISALDDTRASLGKDVGAMQNQLLRTARRASRSGVDVSVQTDDILNMLRVEGQRIGIIDNLGRLKSSSQVANSADRNIVKKLMSSLGADIDNKGNILIRRGTKKSLEEVLPTIRSFTEKVKGVRGDANSIIQEALYGSKTYKTLGLKDLVNDIAETKLNMPQYAKTNRAFAEFMQLRDQLKQLNPDKPANIENFIKGLENIGEWNTEVLSNLESITTKTGTKPFLEDIIKWNAAQDFTEAKPNFLRVAAIAGILGIRDVFQGELPGPVQAGAGLLLGTPAGLRALMLAGSRSAGVISKKALMNTMLNATKAAESKTAGSILTQLLKTQQQ